MCEMTTELMKRAEDIEYSELLDEVGPALTLLKFIFYGDCQILRRNQKVSTHCHFSASNLS
jgi:hypothetical protein